MTPRSLRLLPISLVLACATIGCGKSEPVVDEIQPAAEEPKSAAAEPDTVVSKPNVSEEPGSSGEIVNSIGMKLRLIPAGEFMMGSAKSPQEFVRKYDLTEESLKDFADEHPQHKVRITQPFYLGLTEVTQEQWKSVMGTEPWSGEEGVKVGPVSWGQRSNCPFIQYANINNSRYFGAVVENVASRL